MRIILKSTAALFLIGFLIGCGGDGDGNQAPQLKSITVSPFAGTLLVGHSGTFTAEASDESGAVMTDVIFAWHSTNPTVATAHAGGIALITASNGGVISNAATLNVSPNNANQKNNDEFGTRAEKPPSD